MPLFFKQLTASKFKNLLVTMLTTLLLLFAAGCSIMDELESITNPNESSAPAPTLEDQKVTKPNQNEQQAIHNEKQTEALHNQEEQALTSFKEVSHYIRIHGQLPPNFITKKDAEELGWVAAKGNLTEVAPGKSIGGDRFGNREGLLPKSKGRIWYEADINYVSGRRGSDRIVYSNDGLIYMTTDHYKSFTNITDEGSLKE